MRLSDHQTHRPRREHSLRLQIIRVLTHHFLFAPYPLSGDADQLQPGAVRHEEPTERSVGHGWSGVEGLTRVRSP